MSRLKPQPWVAIDLDGTLANFDCDWKFDPNAIGSPVRAMVNHVKRWLAAGEDVRIFTARMDCYHPVRGRLSEREVKAPIEAWCLKHVGVVLPITNRKDYWCKAIYDDRAYHVQRDTGRITGGDKCRK